MPNCRGAWPIDKGGSALCQGPAADCRDAGGGAPTVGALGGTGAVAGKCAWTRQQSGQFSTHPMCHFIPPGAQAGVSRGTRYGWPQRKPTSRGQVDSQLLPVIQTLFAKGRATYGARRTGQSLEKQNLPVGGGRLGRLMRAAGWVCKTKRKFEATTNAKHL